MTETTKLRECGRCNSEYESYTFFVTDSFTALVDTVTIKNRFGNVCRECRSELMHSSDWGVF